MKPMRYMSEKALLRKLDIPDFRHMTKEKVRIFASSLPYMDRDVALKALEQFPDFAKLANELVSNLSEMTQIVFSQNASSTQALQQSCNDTLAYCRERLSQPDIPQEERIRLERMMLDVIDMMRQIDADNKRFLSNLLTGAGALFLGIAAIAGTALGVAIKGNAQDDYDPEQSNNEYRG